MNAFKWIALAIAALFVGTLVYWTHKSQKLVKAIFEEAAKSEAPAPVAPTTKAPEPVAQPAAVETPAPAPEPVVEKAAEPAPVVEPVKAETPAPAPKVEKAK